MSDFDKDLNNFTFEKDDFQLVNENKKISDVKFETKPTTFLKDAVKRFAKNKSSVVAAYIIAFLMFMSFFVPIVSPHSGKGPFPHRTELPPKLFDAGTGFWDGTRDFTHMAYDYQNKKVFGDFREDAIVSIKVNPTPEIYDTPIKGAFGGYFTFSTDERTDEKGYKFLKVYHQTTIKPGDNFKVLVKLSDIDNVKNEKLGEYQVVLCYLDANKNAKELVLKEWSKDYSEYTLNVSAELNNKAINEANNAYVEFRLKTEKNQIKYIMFENLEFTSDNSEHQELLNAISIKNPTDTALYQKGLDGKYPLGYYQSNGVKGVYQTSIYFCDFTYDPYQAVFGINDSFTIDCFTIEKYIREGLCEYDPNVGPSSFVAKEGCPIIEVASQKSYDKANTLYDITGKVSMYRYYGHNHMPNFLVGTDKQGNDMFTIAFSSLKNSLSLSIVTCLICWAFGLVWGSVSGYFGGNVDLIMERIKEILGGVPYTVVMTLTILLLGNTMITFCIALCLTGWMGIAGRTRTQFYRFKGREYVLASRTLGAKDSRLIFKHILPNASGTIVTSSILMIPSIIFSEATLAYLGLGLQGTNSFGVILNDNKDALSTNPMLVVFPAIIISLIMISFNLFGNGLRDALNPSLKGSE